MSTKTIAGISTTAMSLALAAKNIELAKKKKKTLKDFLEVSTVNLAGLPLLQAQAQLVGDL